MLSGGLDAREVIASPRTGRADAFEAPDRAVAADTPAPIDRTAVAGLAVLLAAAGLWLRSLSAVEDDPLTALGLLSVLPPTFPLAVALLTIGFAVLVARPARHGPLLAAYVATFAVVAHTTSLAVSGELGGAWAWADAGVVDHLQRTGDLPAAGPLASPTGWPGFVALVTLLADVSGLAPSTVMAWTPLGLTLVALGALWVISRSVTGDPRVGWVAAWLFVVGSWVGVAQPVPLALGLVLGLALIAIALPLDRDGGRSVVTRNVGPAGETVGALAAAVVTLALLGLAVVTVDPTATAVAVLTLGLAAATRTSRSWWLAIGLALAGALWLVGPGWPAVVDDGWLGRLAPVGAPAQFATTTAGSLSELSRSAQLVLVSGRFLAQALAVLAVVGLVAWWRRGRPVGFVLGAALVPLVVLAAGVGSEPLLRAFAGAAPWLALAGAFAFAGSAAAGRAATVLRAGVLLAVTACFVVAHSGERGAGHFTEGEVDLVTGLTSDAPALTLLIEPNSNSPAGGRSVDHVRRVPLTDQPATALAELAADPVGTLDARLTASTTDGFGAAYVLLTRGHAHAELVAPRLPGGLLDAVDAELRASDRFVIVAENDDAVVFALDGPAPAAGSEVGS